MKKRVLLSVVALALIIVVCFAGFRVYSNNKNEEKIQSLAMPASFEADISFDYENTDYVFNVIKNAQYIQITAKSPVHLKGVALKMTKEDYSLSFLGMQIGKDKLPDNIKTAVNLIFTVISRLENLEYNHQSISEELITLSYSVGDLNFSCIYDKITGMPKQIKIEELFSLEILNFKTNEEEQ